MRTEAGSGRALTGGRPLLDVHHSRVQVAHEAGIIAVLADAKHEKAKGFYARYEFESLPEQSLTLWLPMGAVIRLFSEK